eukprot:NODE_1531_length_1118_cov_400.596425.p1 GENE.NODE_1531_length_1118_cov_400.596425~~NODE_1531_length_1118_cov_400.596425.p1  ORF type:complete len:302 (+),score=62.48 NODE_1531_length_1118_cov_400.596425:100-906(+)
MSTRAAGHSDGIVKDCLAGFDEHTGVAEQVLKKYNSNEVENYMRLTETEDPLLEIMARFLGVCEPGESYEKRFRLSNLLDGFARYPFVMDFKLGLRSFMESEVDNTEPRPDLFLRLCELDPSAPTEEERRQGACTKYRWMDNQDCWTTTREFGFRADGIADGTMPVPKQELWQNRTVEDTAACIERHLLPGAARDMRLQMVDALLQRLDLMVDVMTRSPFMKANEVIGASLLFVVSRNCDKASIYLIDLAKRASTSLTSRRHRSCLMR